MQRISQYRNQVQSPNLSPQQHKCRQIIGSQFLQLTLLVGGIVALLMGHYELQGIGQIATMVSGGLSVALFIIAFSYSRSISSSSQRYVRLRTDPISGPIDTASTEDGHLIKHDDLMGESLRLCKVKPGVILDPNIHIFHL